MIIIASMNSSIAVVREIAGVKHIIFIILAGFYVLLIINISFKILSFLSFA
jgi:hypothetical protein